MKRLETLQDTSMPDPTREMRYILDLTRPYDNLLMTEGSQNQSFVWGNELLSASGDSSFSYLQDHLGSPIRLLGETEIDTLAYDEFGVPVVGAGNIHQPFGFTCYQMDEVSGLYYAQNRYYEPKLGVFAAEDPIGSGTNWYNYCEGNPIAFIDPLGLDSYIFYDPKVFDESLGRENTGKEYADAMKKDLDKKYGTPTHLIEVTTAEKFKTEWEKMGNNGKIDAVVILGHSNPKVYDFDMSRPGTQELTRQNIRDLTSQEIERLILLGCNTAHSHVPDNVAAAFLANNDVAVLIASDGTTFHYIDENGNYRISSKADEHWYKFTNLSPELALVLTQYGPHINWGFLEYTLDMINHLGYDVAFADLLGCE